MNFYAQGREDQWIVENLPLPDKGFYVDLGCAHPFRASNTAFLRDRKWEGLAVDGNPVWAKDWEDIPAFCCSVISNNPEVLFLEHPDVSEYSRIVRERGRVRCAETVEELLARNEVGKIDFLSVDLEGCEFDILSSLDYELHQPTIIIAEYNTADIGEDLRIAPLLIDHGYNLRLQNPINMIFTK